MRQIEAAVLDYQNEALVAFVAAPSICEGAIPTVAATGLFAGLAYATGFAIVQDDGTRVTGRILGPTEAAGDASVLVTFGGGR